MEDGVEEEKEIRCDCDASLHVAITPVCVLFAPEKKNAKWKRWWFG